MWCAKVWINLKHFTCVSSQWPWHFWHGTDVLAVIHCRSCNVWWCYLNCCHYAHVWYTYYPLLHHRGHCLPQHSQCAVLGEGPVKESVLQILLKFVQKYIRTCSCKCSCKAMSFQKYCHSVSVSGNSLIIMQCSFLCNNATSPDGLH